MGESKNNLMRFSWLFGVMYSLAKIEGRDLIDGFHQKFCFQVYILTLSSNGLLYVKSTIARDLKAANSLAASELFEAIFCFVTHPIPCFDLRLGLGLNMKSKSVQNCHILLDTLFVQSKGTKCHF